jgi:hypothetical protein
MLLIAWPALVLFTIAAPGLPAGIGTALWSATLFSSTVGLEGQEQADFIATLDRTFGRATRHVAHGYKLYGRRVHRPDVRSVSTP